MLAEAAERLADGYDWLWSQYAIPMTAWASLTFALLFMAAWYSDGWMLFFGLASAGLSLLIAWRLGEASKS